MRPDSASSVARESTQFSGLLNRVETDEMATEMSADVFRRSDCRLCGSTDRELVLPLVPTPVGEGYATADRLSDVQPCYPMDLFMCRACGHAEFPDVINPEILYRNYLYQTSVSLGLVEHFRGYADEVVRLVKPAAGSLVIDIGSNDGSLLKFFKGHALRVLGVDPAQEIARGATEAGVETLPDFFTLDLARKIRRERGPATLITANNVFANIDGLVDVAAGIRELLAQARADQRRLDSRLCPTPERAAESVAISRRADGA